MRTRMDPTQPLFTFATFDAADAGDHPTVIADIYEGRLDGAIIRGALSPEAVATVNRRLAEPSSMPRHDFPMFAGEAAAPHVLGKAIVGSEGQLDAYFEDAVRYREGCRRLFAGTVDFESRIASLLAALGGGIDVDVPAGPSGGTYTPSTIRVLTPGHEIGVHVGNEFLRLPQARHLASIVDLEDQISWFVTLQAPEAGGELKVYGLEYGDVHALVPAGDAVWCEGSPVFETIDALDATCFSPQPGDLLLFDGGRWWHRVTRVAGSITRRTIGGFCAYSCDHTRLYYWS